MAKTIERKQGLPNWRDVLNSLYYAVAIPVLTKILETVQSGELEFHWRDLAIVAISGLLSHILRKASEKSKTITVEKAE